MDYGVFEVINNAPQLLEKQLKRILQNQQPRNPIYDVIRKGKSDAKPFQKSVPREDETININYTIMVSQHARVCLLRSRKHLVSQRDAQQLGALAALPEYLALIPRTHTVFSSSSREPSALLWPLWPQARTWHTYIQAKQS